MQEQDGPSFKRKPTRGLLGSGKSSVSLEEMLPARSSVFVFRVDPLWRMMGIDSDSARASSLTHFRGSVADEAFIQDSMDMERQTCCLQRLVVHPETRLRVLWVLFGSCLLCYDMIALPLQLASIWEAEQSMQVSCLAFWVADVLLSFFTGFYKDGVVVMALGPSARAYMKGWFASDASIVALDIVALSVSSVDDSSQDALAFQMARLIRIMRFLRLMRFRRVVEIATRAFDSVESEAGLLVMRVCGLVTGILVLNHFIACAWYAIGVSGAAGPTWLAERDVSTTAHAYVCSFHWALTQFTPATQNIAPTTLQERLYACFVVLIALVVYSTFLGRMTSAMTQLLNLNTKHYQEEAMVRKFLGANKVSASLAQRVWQVRRQQQRAAALMQRVTMKEISTVFNMPGDLYKMLCHEMYQKSFLTMPLLQSTFLASDILTREFCSALEERTAAPVQELFFEGQVARSAMIFTAGTMKYSSRYNNESIDIRPLTWVSEPVLWGCWQRRGALMSTSITRWLDLEGSTFRSVFGQYADGCERHIMAKYAETFERFVDQAIVLDVYSPEQEEVISQMVERSVGTSARFNGSRRSSNPLVRLTRIAMQ